MRNGERGRCGEEGWGQENGSERCCWHRIMACINIYSLVPQNLWLCHLTWQKDCIDVIYLKAEKLSSGPNLIIQTLKSREVPLAGSRRHGRRGGSKGEKELTYFYCLWRYRGHKPGNAGGSRSWEWPLADSKSHRTEPSHTLNKPWK